MQKIEKIEQKLNKRKILLYSGLAIFIVLAAVLINIVVIFPVTQSNAWIYGIIILGTGFAVYLISFFLLTRFHFRIELVSIAVISIGELLIIAFFNEFENIWISIYLILPAATFFGLALLFYYFHSPELRNREELNWGLMLLTATLFGLILEAAIRDAPILSTWHAPLYGIVIIIGGLILYGFTTWKVFKKPSYIMALSGAFITSIGLIMIELYYGLQDILFTLIFLPPAVVFFLLLLANLKLTGSESHNQSAS